MIAPNNRQSANEKYALTEDIVVTIPYKMALKKCMTFITKYYCKLL